jgi:gliding motility-associated-like protein
MMNRLKCLLILFYIFWNQVQAQTVIASFNPDKSSACAPATIRFANLSSGATHYSWSFGNGSSSVIAEPSVVYSQPGTYTVKLRAWNPFGDEDEISQNIVIHPNPRVNFYATDTIFCAKKTVNFTSHIQSNTSIKNYTWDFGDGTLGYIPNPRKTYNDAGLFDVSLVVVDSNNCRSDTTKVRYIQSNRIPIAQFQLEEIKSCKNNVAIIPNNLSNRFLNTTFLWNFGDGNTSTDYHPNHSYLKFGTYSVSLKVGNEFNCFDSIERKDVVEMAPLTAFIGKPNAVCHDVADTFRAQITPALKGAITYRWEFPNNAIRYGRTQVYNLQQGEQEINLSVSVQGCNASSSEKVNVHALPVREIQFSKDTLCDETLVSYGYNFNDGDRVLWFLPDGKTNQRFNDFFQLDSFGKREFTIKVTDKNGCRADFSKSIINSKAVFKLSEFLGDCVPYEHTLSYFYGPFSNGDDYYSSQSLTWNVPHMGISNQSGAAPKILIADTGSFEISAITIDEVGCVREAVTYLGGGNKPKADFSLDIDEICYKDPYELLNKYASGVKPNLYSWGFNGKYTTFSIEPFYRPENFDDPGIYEISHIVSHFGCNDTITKGDTLVINGPMIGLFRVEKNDCSAGNITLNSQVVDYENIWFQVNSDNPLSYSPTRIFNLLPGDSLKLFAYKNSKGCADDALHYVPFGSEPSIIWEIEKDGCIPTNFKINYEWTNLDSVRWAVDGIDILKGASNLPTSSDIFLHETSHTGNFRLTLKGYHPECIINLDTIFKLEGPLVKPLVSRSPGCFPMDFVLFDPDWDAPNQQRRWVVDQDTLEVKANETKFKLSGLKNPNNRIITVKLLAKEGECETFFQYNYAHPGVRFNASFEEEPVNCVEAKLKILFDMHKDDEPKVYGYRVKLSDTSIFSNTPKFDFPIKANGQRDTLYFSALGLDGCVTTQTLYFNRPKPALFADFDVSDSVISCPPAQVHFKNLSFSYFGKITSYEWFLNGEFFSSQANPNRIFTLPEINDISLVVHDDYGCSDTFIREKAISILGPEVTFELGKTMVCFGEYIHFSAQGAEALNIQWDMGDGNLLLGRNISHHYQNTGSYFLQILISDTGSCRYVVPIEDSILIVPPPNPSVFAQTPCKNSLLELRPEYHPIPLQNHFWNIPSFNISSNDEVIQLNTNENDFITIYHKVVDSIGCADSTTEVLRIYGITALFETGKPFYCEGENIKVQDVSSADTTIIQTTFIFKGISFDQREIEISAQPEGLYPLFLKVVNSVGCKDSLEILDAIKIAGGSQKNNSRVKYVSVEDSQGLTLVALTKEQSDFFKQYEIYGEDENLIWSSRQINDTFAFIPDLSPQLASVCLKGGSHHGCTETNTDDWVTHCTVLAEGVSLPMARRITWSPYIGWGFVREYIISRLDGNEYVEIAKVNGGTFEYTDYEHPNCSEVQWYKISALYQFESKSNSEGILPIWNYSFAAPKLQNVSVVDNQWVALQIEKNNNDFFETTKYIIDKTVNSNPTIEQIEIDANESFIDTKVEIASNRYEYRIRQMDECNTISQASNKGTSILLSLDMSSDQQGIELNWNVQNTWGNAISTYWIQRKTDENGFQTVAQITDINNTTFLEKIEDISCAKELCYRIVGISPDNKYESYSNEICNVYTSALYVPNAATPNYDGLNDQFQPLGRFIKDYKMEIFDRWGKRVYATQSCMQGWNCSIENEPAPVGIYVVRIQAIGLDGKRHIHNGTLTLLK